MFFCYWRTSYGCTNLGTVVRVDDSADPKLECVPCLQAEGQPVQYVLLEDADLGLRQPLHGGAVG